MSKIVTQPYKDVKLEFREEDHTFWANGEKVQDSVSAVAGMVDGGKSENLMYWAAKTNRDWLLDKRMIGETIDDGLIRKSTTAYKNYREKKAELGNRVHEWVEKYLKGEDWVLPEKDEVLSATTGFKKWLNKNDLEAKAVEKPTYSKQHDVAGIPDIFGYLNGNLALVDIKTSPNLYFSTRLQLAGYQLLKEEEIKKEIEERWALRLGLEDGEFEAVRYDDHEQDITSFRNALALKKHKEKLEGRRKSTKKIEI